MEEIEKEELIHQLKRTAIYLSPDSTVAVNYTKPDIDKIIPHRSPFALINTIRAVNLQEGVIEVSSLVDANDPIFAGHFPGMPIYPGVMQIESMGQAGLCMAFFLKNDTTEIANGSIPVKGLFTRVHNAGFNKSVMPGDTMIIRVKSLEDDDFMGLMSAQVLVNDEIYSHSILEVFYA